MGHLRNWILCLALVCAQHAFAGPRRVNLVRPDFIPMDLPGVERLIGIGDLHADPLALLTIFRHLNLIDDRAVWTGGSTHVVLVGDILDRGPDSRLCLELLYEIGNQALMVGGRIHLLIGNHELLILNGLPAYTSATDHASYSDLGGIVAAFRNPGSRYAMELGLRNTFLKIGRTLFVHAGPGEELFERPPSVEELARINANFRYMIASEQGKFGRGPWYEEMGWLANDVLTSPVLSPHLARNAVPQQQVAQFHESVGTVRMVVGHKHTKMPEIASRYDDSVLMVDTGNSSYYRASDPLTYGMSALEILDDERVIRHRIAPNDSVNTVLNHAFQRLVCSAGVIASPWFLSRANN